MNKKIEDLGEFGFIGQFAHQFDALINTDDMGIGDDCALLSIDKERYHLVSTDLLIEDIHFLSNEISASELGHKSLAVNLSDIAAMGGKALYSFLSLGIPQHFPLAYLDDFMRAYRKLSEKYHVPLMGGDTTRSGNKLCINVAVIGESLKKNVKLRSMAKTGDIIAVTGHLGDSAAGLKALLDKTPRTTTIKQLIDKHHQPEPRLEEGFWLAQQHGTHAMMDISDGVIADLKHILEQSDKGANLYSDQVPISESLAETAYAQHWNINTLALSGGEDYELLISIDQDQFPHIQRSYFQTFGKELYHIGVINNSGTLTVDDVLWEKEKGFDHFTPTKETHK